MLRTKSVISMFLALLMSTSAVSTTKTYASNQTVFESGLIFEAESDDISSEISTRSENAYSATPVLSQIDLSTDGYFPPIGNQGSVNSCAAWATTYYQFTHDAHKLNNIITTSQNAYSPRWTYNFINGGENISTLASSNYEILKTNGAVPMSEYPYYVHGTYSYDWLNNERVMLNALTTKVSQFKRVYIDFSETQTPITSPTDSDLTEIKQLLCAGKVLVIGTKVSDINMSNCSIKDTENKQKAIYRASFNNNCGGHAMTVVGYDDSIECDFNNDGKIQDAEKGAFKVANSYGTDFGNNGYIWVMYDALNKVSANTPNNWEKSETGTRNPIFDTMGEGANRFYYIEVQNQTVNLAGVVNFTTANCNKIAFDMKRGASSYTALYSTPHINDRPFSGAFVIDFGTLDDNIINYLSGAGWSVKITNKSGKTMTNISYKIVDNLGATVKNAGTLASSLRSDLERSYAINLNMQLGDVDYSGAITSDDQDLVLSYIVKNKIPSSMQRILADYNQDGDVDIVDAIAIGQLLTSNGQTLSSDLDLIARLYREYAIENGLDADVDVSELMNLPEAEKSR